MLVHFVNALVTVVSSQFNCVILHQFSIETANYPFESLKLVETHIYKLGCLLIQF